MPLGHNPIHDTLDAVVKRIGGDKSAFKELKHQQKEESDMKRRMRRGRRDEHDLPHGLYSRQGHVSGSAPPRGLYASGPGYTSHRNGSPSYLQSFQNLQRQRQMSQSTMNNMQPGGFPPGFNSAQQGPPFPYAPRQQFAPPNFQQAGQGQVPEPNQQQQPSQNNPFQQAGQNPGYGQVSQLNQQQPQFPQPSQDQHGGTLQTPYSQHPYAGPPHNPPSQNGAGFPQQQQGQQPAQNHLSPSRSSSGRSNLVPPPTISGHASQQHHSQQPQPQPQQAFPQQATYQQTQPPPSYPPTHKDKNTQRLPSQQRPDPGPTKFMTQDGQHSRVATANYEIGDMRRTIIEGQEKITKAPGRTGRTKG